MFVKFLATATAFVLPISALAMQFVQWTDFADFEVATPVEATSEQKAWAQACERWDDWDKPGPAFRVHGNTWYVGTCGISAILITGDQGHILIDSGTDAGARHVVRNIESLGFDPADIRVLLMSHEHYDHVGGLAWLQQLTGAKVMATEAAAATLRTGEVPYDDPQHGLIEGFAPVEVTTIPTDDLMVSVGQLSLNVIPTPGHTSGATSYNWFACDDRVHCRFIVYADSLSAVSRDDYRFSDHPEKIAQFRSSFQRLGGLTCSILLTPHPGSSQFHTRFENGTFVHPLTCPIYRNRLSERLDARLAREAGDEGQ